MIAPLMPVYNRANLAFEKGEGAYLYSTDGKIYLDFSAGIAVNAFGHAHPYLVKALHEQAQKVWHVSNSVRIPGAERLAQRLCDITFADTVFFNNSGSEAWECGVKTIRKYFTHIGQPQKTRFIVFEGCFHGRSMTGIAAAKTEKMAGGFGPLIDMFDQVAWGDLDAVRKAITPETACIHIEVVQGEGGMRAGSKEFIQGLRKLCDEHGLLLFFDEIQCGMGRTGKLFAYEWMDVVPDVVCAAKGIGGGFPLGACLASEKAAAGMNHGTHGSTYGGNPLAMAVGNAVLDLMLKPEFLAQVNRVGAYMWQKFDELIAEFPAFFDGHRGKGLMQGLRCINADDNLKLVAKLRENGLLSVAASGHVVRFLPPLIIEEKHVDEAVVIIKRTVTEYIQAKEAA
ncbi:MAG: aspartate aminotransferase family protein [Alphaproteobacteria bacterium]|nr:aspartate aminotransferase family protein [Alphaproteobacteria bacterium]